MGLSLSFSCLFSLLVLLPVLCSSQDPFVSSRAAYYGSPECFGTPTGACGFGEFGRNINGGDVGAVAKLYRNGAGCGACYQVSCTNPKLCLEDGLKIVVTDHGEGDNTDFILSASGFAKLARPGMDKELIARGVVDIEYRRISCRYPGHNLMFKVHEHSKFPDYIAIIILYQSGKKDVTAMELWQEDSQQWKGMRRAYGGVWDMVSPPKGALTVRVLASDNDGQKWFQMRNVIPGDWKAGVPYDSTLQLF
ncbi:expansin-like protein B1 [Cinnamomum micranthum f. kanehirae]|uniref:Expansin-like protein B1 n=1 Tax=Cinnamomum micranthum f. kanehirae TaxID=337451 RepID=A0A443PG12_9MAGN|nr:expansin-like protein B1 [Cinnamomum micranthum f. kanehirae]